MNRQIRRPGRGRSPLGIDIGQDGIRLLQPRRLGGHEIRHAAFVDRREHGPDVADLRRALHGFSGREAVVSVPIDELEIRPARLPRLEGEELREAARWEIAGLLEVEGADLVAEPVPVSRQPGDDGRLEMLIVAARAARVSHILDPLLEAGVRPVAVEPAFLAAGRTFCRRSRRDVEQETVRLVVSVDPDSSAIVVMRGDAAVFVKPVAVGSRDFDLELARELHIDQEEARRTRIDASEGRMDGLVHEAVRNAIRRAARPVVEEAAMSLRYATVAARLGRPVGIHVTGVAARVPGLVEAIEAGIPGVSLVADDLLDARLDGSATIARHGGAPAWTTAFGLTLRPMVRRENAA
ncbi:MAG: pilus assembly protein PilM [Planctomycetota bacterium]|nr:pilus assembly protein PilM [Planctomycetota bacterium]